MPDRSPVTSWRRLLYALLAIAVLAFRVHFFVYHLKALKQVTPLTYRGGVVRPEQLTGVGRICLVRIGPQSEPYNIVDLAAWLREKYSINTEVLPAVSLSQVTYDPSRHLHIAERMLEDIKRHYPELAADPKVVLIGVTDTEMYAATEFYSNIFTQRDSMRTAIITTHEITQFRLSQRNYFQSHTARLTDRLHRILLKDVALLFWHLTLNNDPDSILYAGLNPYLPGAELYQTDLDPLHTPWGLYVTDPCIVFTHIAGSGISVPSPLFQQCQTPESSMNAQGSLASSSSLPDTSQERIELRLGYGLLTEKHTDFFLPGTVPIRFERAISNQSEMPQAFGMSGSHNYDRFLVTHDNMRNLSIVNPGSGDTGLSRHPSWLPLLPFNTWVDSDTSGYALALRWQIHPTQQFLLSRFNGETESYLPCTDAELCYLTGYTNPAGQSLVIRRDSQRTLTSLSAPQNNWLHVGHDDPWSKIRITSILDSRGRAVHYEYSQAGQLAAVSYPDGETIHYTWDSSQNLLSVSAALAGKPSVILITNRYDRGHLVAQTLTDGSVYTYAFMTGADRASRLAEVITPDGSHYDILMGIGSRAAIRVHQDMQPLPGSVNLHRA